MKNKVFLGVLAALCLAIVVTQGYKGYKLRSGVLAYSTCVVDHDCTGWCDLSEEDRERYNMNWASANPVECVDAVTGEVPTPRVSWLQPVDEVVSETPSDPVDLRAGFPAVFEQPISEADIQEPTLDPPPSWAFDDMGPDQGFLQFLDGQDLP